MIYIYEPNSKKYASNLARYAPNAVYMRPAWRDMSP